MPGFWNKEEATLLFLAALLLVVGVTVNAVDRGGAAYFLIGWTPGHANADLFDAVGRYSPLDASNAAVSPAWFDDVPALEARAACFTNSTCDPLEILSAGFGPVAAYCVVRAIERGDLR
jgi:hypothetical protein